MTEPLQPAGGRGVVDLHDQDDITFAGAVVWTIAGTVVPGLGLLRARRRFDGVMTLIFFVMVVAMVGFLVYERDFASALLQTRITLIGIAVLCGMLGILITGVILATYLALRPHVLTPGQRTAGAALVLALCFVACFPLAVGAGYTLGQAGVVH